MRLPLVRMAALAATIGAAAPAAADVRLTLTNGQVTLSASNATVPQILAEWARVGRTRIVNGERVTGAPITIELKDMPEAQALEIVLRSASGFVLAPRPVGADGSTYDRIYVIPTSNAPRPPTVAPPAPPPAFAAPRFAPGPPAREDNDGGDERRVPPAQTPPVQILPVAPPQFAPTPGTVASPATVYTPVGAQPRGNSPAATPGAAPFGVPVPGMVTPTPSAAPGAAPTTANPQR
jgi:hypothetical protein